MRSRHACLLLTLLVVSAGCAGSDLPTLDSDGDAEVTLTVVEASSEGPRVAPLAVAAVLLHPAGVPLEAPHPALTPPESPQERPGFVNGSVPAGSYDRVTLRIVGLLLDGGSPTTGSAMEQTPAGEGNVTRLALSGPGPWDLSLSIPDNATFTLEAGQAHHLQLTVDLEGPREAATLTVHGLDLAREGESPEPLPSDARLNRLGGFVLGDDPPQPPGPAPEVAIEARLGDGTVLDTPRGDTGFLNGRSDPVQTGTPVHLEAPASSRPGAEGATSSVHWEVDGGHQGQGPNLTVAFQRPGAYEVHLTVVDERGAVGTTLARLVVDRTNWTAALLDARFDEGSTPGWRATTSDDPMGRATSWQVDTVGRASARAFHVGHHLHADAADGTPGYTSNAQAVLFSPPVRLPTDWRTAGYSLWVSGGSAPGDTLTIEAVVDGQATELANLTGEMGWTLVEDERAFEDVLGATAQLRFTFTSDAVEETGPGWLVDDVVIGGVDLDVHKPRLFEQAPP